MRLAAALALVAAGAHGQPAKLINARLDTRPAAGLEAAFRRIVADPRASWIGYSVPASRASVRGCDSHWHDGEFAVAGGTVYLEPPRDVLALFRVEGGKIGKVRTLAPGCEIDAGGAAVHWLTGVVPEQSVALLAGMVEGAGKAGVNSGLPVREAQSAVAAIAAHSHASAVSALTMLAREHERARVRGDALFWLARLAGGQATGTIRQAVESDPEREVKRRALAALLQMPGGDGVPPLIEIARSSRDRETRRQAMAMLGQSKDPRAAAFFEQVLR